MSLILSTSLPTKGVVVFTKRYYTQVPLKVPLKDIAIVGAGIGGLTLGIELGRKGHTVNIYEAAPILKSALGAGYGISSGAIVLDKRLGLLEEIKKISVQAKKVIFESETGKEYANLNTTLFNKIDPDLNIYWILRDQMQMLLHRNLPPSTTLHLGHNLVNLQQRDGLVELEFDNNTTKKHDFVVGVDGIKSKVREIIFGESEKIFSGFGVYYGVVKRGNMDDPHLTPGTGVAYFIHSSNGMTFLVFPCGGNDDYVYALLYRSKEPIKESWDLTIGQNNIMELLHNGKYPKFVHKIVENSTRMMNLGIYTNKTLKEKWHSGRVVVMGDAAHATSPFLGQGANQAVLDAACLTRHFEEFEDLDIALKGFHKVREPVTTNIIRSSRIIGKLDTSTGLTASFYHALLKVSGRTGLLLKILSDSIKPVY